ncbi:unnamed protein product [Phytophthora lilii]|uniref:Unnamed protein product n=1 Tax=Phytophthora lilii TaxID=2077276 RepID=A0A9W6TB69_9STRA|nr:unnamed protein product [Phytophthora lilii]
MECSVPDFPRGVIVRVAVAMNGVEFVQCPGELRVFQSPRLTEIFPNWVSATTTLELELRGINLTAAITTTSTDDNSRNQQDVVSVQVSFSSNRGRKVIRGVCGDGQVRCPIPREILQVPSLGRDKGTSHSTTATPPILFTGSPLPLHVYREIPIVHVVSPMDGPVYGGFAIVVEGHGFIDTGKIIVRFQLYTEHLEGTPGAEDENQKGPQTQGLSPTKSASTLNKTQSESGKDGSANEKVSQEPPPVVTESPVSYVDVVAKFVSAERVLCPAPSFPLEGVYTVLVALNGVEFSRVSDGSWFLAWQNWQKRKRLLSHALFSRATAPEEAASAAAIAGAAAASASLGEDDIERLRRKSSFMLPKIKSAMAATPGEASSASFKAKSIDSVSEESTAPEDTEDMLMKDPRLLQWQPTSNVETRVSGRPLLSLFEYLCSTRETQLYICRRLRVAFKLQSTKARDTNNSIDAIPALRFPLFAEAVRMIFPNALMRDLEELWHAAEHRPDGTMTIKQLLRRLLRYAAPDQRSSSPEPGPTHYDPRYSIVSSRESAAIIFPPVVQPEHILDPPSALFIDYDAAVQAVRPRPPRPVFRKRKFNTSWCNPIVEGAREPAPPSPRPPSDGVRTRPSSRTRVGEDVSSTTPSEMAVNVDASMATTITESEDDVVAGTRKADDKSSEQSTSEARKAIQAPPQKGKSSKEDAVRTPRTLAQATIASSNKRTRSPRSPRATKTSVPLLPPASAAPINVPPVMPRQTNLSGPNPFYNDIAPLYAKFLNSTEVKRFLKQ